MSKRNPLLDIEFLKALDRHPNKETYARICLLTFDEHPVEEIQGKITQGSVNIDGNSALRRTCSLTMVTNDTDINNTYFALKNKFKLEVGVTNDINPDYPDIIWFKQGIYVFTSLNISVQQQNYTITLQGKDKMCLLNGEIGGSIMAQTDFGKLEEYSEDDNGDIIRTEVSLPIVDIIKNAVYVYGGQPIENIVLNDIDDYGLELLEYRNREQPMYLLRDVESGWTSNMTLDGNRGQGYFYVPREWNETKKEWIYKTPTSFDFTFGTLLDNNQGYTYYNLADLNEVNKNAIVLYTSQDINDEDTKAYYLVKISYGETCGYRMTELTYPGDLIANVGESLVSVLDKIKNTFSDFEYFFDIDGRFIFQKKKTYVNTTWNPINTLETQTYVEDAAYSSSVAYSFEQGVLLSAFTNAPAIANIKNDFAVWGKRKTASGADVPVHMRYAIDFKPEYYKSVRWKKLDGKLVSQNGNLVNGGSDSSLIRAADDGTIYYTKEYSDDDGAVDWREIIYQMAKDYYAFDYCIEDFKQVLAAENADYYPTGKTGYENYYIDLQAFWRQLYMPIDELQKECNELIENITDAETDEAKKVEQGYLDSFLEEWEIKINKNGEIVNEPTGWNTSISKYPENLNFWIDFLDADDADLSKYTISAIGCRSKGVNNDKVKAIYFKETPSVLFLSTDDYSILQNDSSTFQDMTGYTFIRLTSQIENLFTISAQGLSAKDQLDSLLYQHTYATENVTLTAVPIYHLQPNVRIFVKDEDSKVEGEYIITKITISLQYNGTSSITASKAVNRIY